MDATASGTGRRRSFLLWFLAAAAIFLAGTLVGYVVRGATRDPAIPVAPPATRDALHRAPSTVKMVERLARITAGVKPGDNPFMNGGRADELTEVARQNPTAPLLMELGTELLNAGRTDESIALLGSLEKASRGSLDPHSKPWATLRIRQAIAQLRRAENDNCVEHHNPHSCLFPIQKEGVHGNPRGARAAMEILQSLLEDNPDQLQARWLLNVAAMTLGEYPDGVPKRWLLAPELFASEYDLGRFPDIAAQVGLDVDDYAGGSIVDDFDGDGNLDIFASSMGRRSQIRFFRNNGDGSFTEKTHDAGLDGLFGGLNIMQTDYDNDGRPDVLVLRGGWMLKAGRYPRSLLHNDGDGLFSDRTEEAGLIGEHPSQTGVWRDFDGDGWLDLFIGNESTEDDPHPCQLFRNNGDGTFTECAVEAGVAITEYVKGVAAGDYDNDGRPDIYVSVRGGRNHLYHNVGSMASARGARVGWSGRFVDVAAAAGVRDQVFTFPTWFFDYDNDGWEDIFVSGYHLSDAGDILKDYLYQPHKAELPRLYHNRGDGTFTDVTVAVHLNKLMLSMGSNYGDFDNDGWLDFLVGTGDPDLGQLVPDRAFRNDSGRVFQDVATSLGMGHLQKGHGVSFADLDNDGDQDIYHIVGGALEADHFRNALYENPGHGNHFLVLRLEGVRSNRPAIGARIKVVVLTPNGERSIYKTVSSGGSFGSSPLRQEIGLGDAVAIDRAEIRWPSGGPVQVVRGLEIDRRY
ncbi:MAG TPA: CRTAC1 family protein, partial [Candidatus Polarisedimenticolia bacterium]|nr:CRTAC1 family protein [Candidatus Polarisedimenticolia bacterium]